MGLSVDFVFNGAIISCNLKSMKHQAVFHMLELSSLVSLTIECCKAIVGHNLVSRINLTLLQWDVLCSTMYMYHVFSLGNTLNAQMRKGLQHHQILIAVYPTYLSVS